MKKIAQIRRSSPRVGPIASPRPSLGPWMSSDKTRQQTFEVFRCALAHLNDISVRAGAGRVLVARVRCEKRVLSFFRRPDVVELWADCGGRDSGRSFGIVRKERTLMSYEPAIEVLEMMAPQVPEVGDRRTESSAEPDSSHRPVPPKPDFLHPSRSVASVDSSTF